MRFISIVLPAVLFLSATIVVPAHGLVINEFMAVNDATILDEDGDSPDWVEIHNETGAAVDMSGWYLTDQADLLTRWQFPSVSIPAGDYLLVWASDKNRAIPGSPLHANFKLSSAGEYLALVQPGGVTIEHEYAPEFPEQLADISYGLALDLITERCFLDPTPGAQNDETPGCVFIAEIGFSVERGFYDAPFSVALSTTTPGATIHYTLDGSDPDQSNGTVYTVPIDVSTTTMLRAMAFKAAEGATPSVTHTYIFLDDVVQQSAASIPAEYLAWGGNDWEMDPEIVNDPAYASTITDDLRTIPSLSIVTEGDHLFGDANGIYTHPQARGVEWERPASAEFIYPDGSDDFQVNCGVRIQGGSSRHPTWKKHSLRLLFKGIYGPTKLEFAVFDDSPVEEFDTITFSARNSKTWHQGSRRAQYIRDTWSKDTQLDMGQLSGHSQHFHLYLNGLYWGLYRGTERPDSSFFASHLGGDESEYDVRKSTKVIDGNDDAWDTMHDLAGADLSVQANYDALLQYLDVESLIVYMIMNLYAENTDWDFHNWYAGRQRQPGAGYKFVSWDAENVLDKINENRTGTSYHRAPSSLYDKLRKHNQEFRTLFGDHVHRYLFNGGALMPEQAAGRFMERSREIDRAVVGESARWGDKSKSVPFTRDVHWVVERQWLLLAYFPIRSDVALAQFQARDLYPTVVAPSFNQHGGRFSTGFELTMEAPVGTIYYTDDGSDPRLAGGSLSPAAQVYGTPIALADSVVEIAARALDGGDWSALNQATFMPDSPIRITEMMFHPVGGSDHEFIELENIGAASYDTIGLAFTDGIAFSFPSVILAPGDHLLAVANTIEFEAHYGAGLPVAGQYTGNLSNGGESVRLEAPGGSIVHDFSYDDRWYPSTDGGGFSLVVRDPTADPDLWEQAAGWRASTFLDGSAGAAELPACSDTVDNDNDADIDFPDDAGCGSATQDFEDTACDDGVDNDDDGDVDLADADCESAVDDSESAPAIDPFLCYRSRRDRDGPELEDVNVVLSDAFDTDVTFMVRKERALCLPGDLNEDTAADVTTHLTSYQIKEASGQPRHTARTNLQVENLFGLHFLNTDKPDRLLVPSAMDVSQAVSAPDSGSHNLDFYKCYKVRVAGNTPAYFPKDAIAKVKDQFEARKYRLKKPKHLCTAVNRDGGGIKDPDQYLLCYQAKYSKFDDRHVRRTGVHTANVFGQGLLDTSKEEELCVPSRLLGEP